MFSETFHLRLALLLRHSAFFQIIVITGLGCNSEISCHEQIVPERKKNVSKIIFILSNFGRFHMSRENWVVDKILLTPHSILFALTLNTFLIIFILGLMRNFKSYSFHAKHSQGYFWVTLSFSAVRVNHKTLETTPT